MNTIRNKYWFTEERGSYGLAWMSLCFALALHVMDEAKHDFLAVYNPTVLAIRQKLPFLPLPTFSFEVWMAGLVTAVILLLCLSPFAFHSAKWLRIPARIFAGLMILNGVQHIVGSIYMGHLMPGVYSSPLLIAAGVYLLKATTGAR
ncbi:MAG TPA: HXXEE domain-containing protein [Blastocatellia bacterium]|nr:HXXEE domain-containing protein [Blastocatellia bacterium]